MNKEEQQVAEMSDYSSQMLKELIKAVDADYGFTLFVVGDNEGLVCEVHALRNIDHVEFIYLNNEATVQVLSDEFGISMDIRE